MVHVDILSWLLVLTLMRLCSVRQHAAMLKELLQKVLMHLSCLMGILSVSTCLVQIWKKVDHCVRTVVCQWKLCKMVLLHHSKGHSDGPCMLCYLKELQYDEVSLCCCCTLSKPNPLVLAIYQSDLAISASITFTNNNNLSNIYTKNIIQLPSYTSSRLSCNSEVHWLHSNGHGQLYKE